VKTCIEKSIVDTDGFIDEFTAETFSGKPIDVDNLVDEPFTENFHYKKKIEITYRQNPYVMAKNPYVIILHTDLHTDENPYVICSWVIIYEFIPYEIYRQNITYEFILYINNIV